MKRSIAKQELISYDYVKNLYFYDKDQGTLYSFRWKKIVGREDKGSGYLVLELLHKWFLVHLLIWLYMTGEWPPVDKQIDHINGNKLDNRWENLRLASDSGNKANRKPFKNNTSGYKGVYYDKRINKWAAHIKIDRVSIRIGSFLTKEEAALAYNIRAKETWGEFAYLNKIVYNDETKLDG